MAAKIIVMATLSLAVPAGIKTRDPLTGAVGISDTGRGWPPKTAVNTDPKNEVRESNKTITHFQKIFKNN